MDCTISKSDIAIIKCYKNDNGDWFQISSELSRNYFSVMVDPREFLALLQAAVRHAYPETVTEVKWCKVAAPIADEPPATLLDACAEREMEAQPVDCEARFYGDGVRTASVIDNNQLS